MKDQIELTFWVLQVLGAIPPAVFGLRFAMRNLHKSRILDSWLWDASGYAFILWATLPPGPMTTARIALLVWGAITVLLGTIYRIASAWISRLRDVEQRQEVLLNAMVAHSELLKFAFKTLNGATQVPGGGGEDSKPPEKP